jgi:small basic protein
LSIYLAYLGDLGRVGYVLCIYVAYNTRIFEDYTQPKHLLVVILC